MWGLLMMLCTLASCNITSALEDDEQLYVGTKSIEYKDVTPSRHLDALKEEIDVALAAAPNGALFGSSSLRSPLSARLWIWSITHSKNTKLNRWLNHSFGTEPVLVSDVNPVLRTSVVENTLANYGYFRGKADYRELIQKNPKMSKLAYTITPGHLFTLDTIFYARFPECMDTLITSTRSESLLRKDDAFQVTNLDAERQRLSTLLRNNGYYYYTPGCATFYADTVANEGKVALRMQLLDSLDSRITRQWRIGKTDIRLHRTYGETLTDTMSRRHLSIHFSGKQPPVRPRIILSSMRLRPQQLFTEDGYRESLERVSANEIFSMVEFQFTPRDTTDSCQILDMAINCVMEKPYDLTLEANVTGKTSSRMGPGAKATFSKRNAFRYGEKLSLALYGSYEWQTGSSGTSDKLALNSYEYGGDITLELPRLLLPLWLRKRWDYTPKTIIKVSNKVVNRGSFFNRHVMAGELTYTCQPTSASKHIFSPLVLQYDYMNRSSAEFQQILHDNPYLYISMQDQFIPKLRYSYIYTSPSSMLSPVTFEATFSESSNILSLAYLAAGKSWNEQGKSLLGNPYAQFVKFEADVTKKWYLTSHSDLVGHINVGVMYSYGNSSFAPYSEQFYVGGANSIRAFTVRSIGPGRYHTEKKGLSYLDQTGDIKFVANLEYRPRLFGNFYGAVFVDAGNVWAMKDDGIRGADALLRPKSLLKDMALATGLGVRYDLDFFVIRVDWGIGLHMPYDTGKTGYFNIPALKNVQSIHLAIGYPF